MESRLGRRVDGRNEWPGRAVEKSGRELRGRCKTNEL